MRKLPWILFALMLPWGSVFPAPSPEMEEQKDISRTTDSLNRISRGFLENNPETSRKLANEALTLSTRSNYVRGQISALTNLSKYSLSREDYIRTLELFFRIIDLSERNHYTDDLVMGYSMVIQFFLTIKDFDLAEKYLAMLDRITVKTDDPALRAQYFFHRAKCNLARGDYDHAIRDFYLCFPGFCKATDLLRKAAVYKFLGDSYLQKKMLLQAEYFYRQSLSDLTILGNHSEIAIIYTRIAHIYQLLNDNHLNLKYNLAAMRVREHTGHLKLISSSYLNVGEAFWLLGSKDSARVYFNKSLDLARRIRNNYQLEAIYSRLTEFAKTEKRYEDALRYFMACAEYRTRMSQEQNRSKILVLEANRTISGSEAKNELMNQEILFQNLQIRNRRIQILLFEAAFIVILVLIMFIDTLARKNRKRKNELKELNERLSTEIAVRIEAVARLRRSEDLHRFLAENMVDVISLMDAGMNRLYISPSCEKAYGYRAEEILRMSSPLELVEPGFRQSVSRQLNGMLRSKRSIRYIYKALRKDGSSFWAEANINPILDQQNNEVKHIITVVRNISERKKHEEELAENSRQKEYLLREIHNRVKNNFAILISLMNMQRDQSDNAELSNSLADLQLRVRTMSLVHEELYKTRDISTIPFDVYLSILAMTISKSFNNDLVALKTDIRPCTVAIETAMPLGLIINELITNAYKYAFPGNRTGTILISLLPAGQGRYCISVRDDGIGLPADYSMTDTRTMGSQIIRMLVEQIEASLEFSRTGGTGFRILFSPEIEK